MKRSNTAAIIFNAAIFGMTVSGYLISVFFPQQNRLPATGVLGLRYFTTLSNFFFHLVIPLAAI